MEDLFRVLLGVFLAMHGVGHMIWFLPAWTRIPTGVGDGAWLLPGNVTLRSPIGKVLSLLALMAMVVFVGAGVALLAGQTWWADWTYLGIFLSFGAVVPWFRQSPGSSAVTAILADLVLLFAITIFGTDLV